MITRQEIIDELKKVPEMDKSGKDIVVSAFLDSKDVPEEEKDKILSDLNSYAEY